ncbi:lysophospholipid acyltransferase family protein [Rickettsiales bacterium LUAb2]
MSLLIIIIRNILFYICLIIIGVIGTPIGNIYALFANKRQATAYTAGGAKLIRIAFHLCMGVKVEYRGLENLIKGACIVASKHQSAYETTLFFNMFYPRLAYALKKEVKYIFPYLYIMYSKYDGVEVDRKDGAKALIKMEQAALKIIKEGRQFAIFPEGTRVPIGKEAEYKRGVLRLYEKANVPVVPVALNTGTVWPKDSWLYYPGKIIIEFLPTIKVGLSSEEFMLELQTKINTATTKLLAETPCNYYMRKKGLCN